MLKALKRVFNSKPEVSVKEMKFERPARAPLSPITLVSADCPYCGVEIDPPPTRGRKCPHCAEVICTYTNQETRKKVLLTEKGVEHLERQQWHEGWQRLNAEVVEAYKTGDWGGAEIAHFNQAVMLFDKGRDHRQSAHLSRQDRLRGYQTSSQIYSDKVMVQSNGCCDECASKEGLTLTIAAALMRNPIPHDDCQSLRDKNEFGGWCRCEYDQVLGAD